MFLFGSEPERECDDDAVDDRDECREWWPREEDEAGWWWNEDRLAGEPDEADEWSEKRSWSCRVRWAYDGSWVDPFWSSTDA